MSSPSSSLSLQEGFFCESFCFCSQEEASFALAAFNRLFPSLSQKDQEKLSGFLDAFQSFVLAGSYRKEDAFDDCNAEEEALPFD